MATPQPIFSVSDCLALINQTLDYAYSSVLVEGEISSFKINKSKFVFFDIKDETALLSCFMMVYQLKAPLEDGMKVRVYAKPRLTAWGKFSLTVHEVVPIGEGSLKRSFAMLQAKLAAEGLFDIGRKRLLPAMPTNVGLIASTESAGYHDFIKIINNRWPDTNVTVANVQVQGGQASSQVMRALQYFNQQAEPVEVLVLIRGGGSAEDLAVFNEEPLVRAVAASRIPTVVGVGHEVDVSLCDQAADVRAATPSNAAELLVPDRAAIRLKVAQQQRTCGQRLTSSMQQCAGHIERQTQQCVRQMDHRLAWYTRHLSNAEQLLRQLDPKVALRRGYALVRNEQGQLLKGAGNRLEPGDNIGITLEHVIIKAEVSSVQTI
jgi:exodeoxyribonuclease VII large subunit